MKQIEFQDREGTFIIHNPENYSALYLPLAGERGLKSSITPTLGGDSKTDQNHFLLEPVSIENLHNNRSTRNFWCRVKGKGYWSANGVSAEQECQRYTAEQDESVLEAGFMWQKLQRTSKKYGIHSEITSFVTLDGVAEAHLVEFTNVADEELEITPIAAIPIYGRSADNIRDHRHVTSLLHRIETKKYGVEVTPVLSFDERGHQKNHTTYFVYGSTEDGTMPKEFYPTVEMFIGRGGSFLIPEAVRTEKTGVAAGTKIEGKEAVGGLAFETVTLQPKDTVAYIVLAGITEEKEKVEVIASAYRTKKQVLSELEKIKQHWKEKVNVEFETGNADVDNYLKWICFQPILRRIYGCSFLPYHDYGKGGRGWRDLWQDCLALLIMEPEKVREMLIDNFGGVRFDGTNATIIGSKQGEFIADRNNIVRVWMDHGAWPYLTTRLYMQQTGDIEFLTEANTYFKDAQICRGEKRDDRWNDTIGNKQMTEDALPYEGTVLEHLLIQHLTSFYDVGEHNHIRLRGADWNDGLDMAEERGESVAFTALYGGNLKNLAQDIKDYSDKTGKDTVSIAKEILVLLEADSSIYDSIGEKNALLEKYCDEVGHIISGEKTEVKCDWLADKLTEMSNWITDHIRNTEWTSDKEGNSWFNGYYDNSGKAVEGDFESGVRMMLTGQVFTVMSGVATDEQVAEIAKAADKYLYDEAIGGYRLNTDFKEVKTDMGRLFGFAFGHKENGAVFSHMAVMYANALYSRGFAKEGYKVINTLYKHCADYHKSNIYPGVPEYVNQRGQGMYHYLTGAASWLLLTVLNEMYGIKGELGALKLAPKLLAEQFSNGMASATCMFRGANITVTYQNPFGLEAGEYTVKEIYIDGDLYGNTDTIAKEDVDKLGDKSQITAILG